MAGGDFWPLWRTVMDVASHHDLREADEAWFDALYDLVYISEPTRSANRMHVTESSVQLNCVARSEKKGLMLQQRMTDCGRSSAPAHQDEREAGA